MDKTKTLQSIALAAFLALVYAESDRIREYLKWFENHPKGLNIAQVQKPHNTKADAQNKVRICGKIIDSEYGSLQVRYYGIWTNDFPYKIIEVESSDSPDKSVKLLSFAPARYSVGGSITAEYVPLTDGKATLEELSRYTPSMLRPPKDATGVVEGIDGIFPY